MSNRYQKNFEKKYGSNGSIEQGYNGLTEQRHFINAVSVDQQKQC
jgi:hypothetical protein